MSAWKPLGWLLAVICGLCLLPGCKPEQASKPAVPPPKTKVVRLTSATGQAEVLLKPTGHPVIGLVLYMHGIDSDQDQILKDGQLFGVRNALLAAGYAIVSSYAHGNNAGNPASVQDQYDAYSDATDVLGSAYPVGILGFSMGGLDALLVAAKHVIPGLRAVALLSPATDQQTFLTGRFGGSIVSAFSRAPNAGTLTAIKAWDPMLLPAHDYRGYRYAFWHSHSDHTVPASQSSRMAKHLAAASIVAPVHPLTGGHGDLTALKPSAVLALFAGTR